MDISVIYEHHISIQHVNTQIVQCSNFIGWFLSFYTKTDI